jgi:hypothetical protein
MSKTIFIPKKHLLVILQKETDTGSGLVKKKSSGITYRVGNIILSESSDFVAGTVYFNLGTAINIPEDVKKEFIEEHQKGDYIIVHQDNILFNYY